MARADVPQYNEMLWPTLQAVAALGGSASIGEIVETGSNVKDFHVGEIVSGEGHVVCGRCSRPRFVGAQSKEPRPSAATMRRRPAQPADPVPPARAPQSPD